MKTVKLVSISEVKTEKQRIDGKVSRKYYTAYFADAQNPFAKQVQRNIFQSHSTDGIVATWKSGDPALVKSFVGKEIPGEFVNSVVEPYKIDGREVNSFTTVVLAGENVKTIFKQSGHTIVEETKEESVVENEILAKESSIALNK